MGIPYKGPADRDPFSAPGVGGVTFGTLTAEAVNARTQSLQVVDQAGRPVAAPVLVRVWLSDVATGLGVTAQAASSDMTAGTNGKKMAAMVSGVIALFQADTSGRLDVTITDTAVRTIYLAVETVGGLAVTSAIAFA